MTTTTTRKTKGSKAKTSESALATREAFIAPARLRVNKAYKMYVGGAFIRSESGR